MGFETGIVGDKAVLVRIHNLPNSFNVELIGMSLKSPAKMAGVLLERLILSLMNLAEAIRSLSGLR